MQGEDWVSATKTTLFYCSLYKTCYLSSVYVVNTSSSFAVGDGKRLFIAEGYATNRPMNTGDDTLQTSIGKGEDTNAVIKACNQVLLVG